MKITIEGVGPDDGITEDIIRMTLDDAFDELGYYDRITIEVDE